MKIYLSEDDFFESYFSVIYLSEDALFDGSFYVCQLYVCQSTWFEEEIGGLGYGKKGLKKEAFLGDLARTMCGLDLLVKGGLLIAVYGKFSIEGSRAD